MATKKQAKKSPLNYKIYSARLEAQHITEIERLADAATMKPRPFLRGIIKLALAKVAEGVVSYDEVRRAGIR